ncbi:unnamed protein product [Rhizoctonia solani]|uniref:Gpi1-domain-containing protein n=1 Tax=Rhizoctonia solani TaxID=456999 RepID=A0A8H3CPC7_9AGAM|nr:unnamed protein product [Rhizoctonia solani]
MRHGQYIFIPENVSERDETKTYYGWVWESAVIIVGRVSPELAEEQINYVNSLNLRLSTSSSAPLPPLAVLDDLTVIRESEKPLNWVMYRSPNLRAQRFYTVNPLQLDLVPKSEAHNPSQNAALLDAVITTDSTRLEVPGRLDMPSMDIILDYVNIASVVDQLAQGKITTSSLIGSGRAPTSRVPPAHTSRAWNILKTTILTYLPPAELVCNLRPEQYGATKPGNVQDIARSTARYINFFNCVWLIANDIIIGTALGGFICENKDALAHIGSQFIQHYFIKYEALNMFRMATPYFPLILYCIGNAGTLGATMVLSLISDFLNVLTLHTYVCYLLATTVFARLLKLIGSLFNLFRGKRRNILRNRTDTWNYDMDQLMLGTILFTLVTFLFPTVTVYYMLFTMTRLGIIGMQACLETILAFLNHFPLFALMLRVKDPARLPGGVELRLKTRKEPLIAVPSTRLELVNKPIPYSQIFFQHSHQLRESCDIGGRKRLYT